MNNEQKSIAVRNSEALSWEVLNNDLWVILTKGGTLTSKAQTPKAVGNYQSSTGDPRCCDPQALFDSQNKPVKNRTWKHVTIL